MGIGNRAHDGRSYNSYHGRFDWKHFPPLWAVGAAFAAALLAALAALWLLPTGYGGTDDYHYLQAALRWVTDGPYAGTDHWQTRLPYVFGLALAFLLPLPADMALFVPNILGFCALVVSLCVMASRALGASAAVWTGLVLIISPFFLRRATVLYPEMAEAGLATAGLVMAWTAAARERGGSLQLAVAGALAALAFMIRQTALALSLCFCAWVVIRHRRDLSRAISLILPYAAGAFAVLSAEMLFYAVLTGDPLWRLRVDLGHVLVPSHHMDGMVYRDGLPLFNADLAARWKVPGFLQMHWTVAGLGRLLLDPSVALFVVLATAGLVPLVFRGAEPAARDIGLIVVLAVLFQWLLNTFVMTLAPNTRYFTNAAALLALPAGYLLSHLPRRAGAAAGLLLLLYLPTVVALQPYLASVDAQVRQVRAWTADGSHYLGGAMARRTLLLRLAEPAAGARLMTGEPPVGATMIADWVPDPGRRENLCEDGTGRWQLIDSFAPRTRAGVLIRRARLDRYVDGAIVARIEGAGFGAYLLRRAC